MLTTLKNGRTIIEQKRMPDGFYVVLARTWMPDDAPQLVCWMANADGHCFSGHYGWEALDSYRERCGRGGAA